MPHTWVFFEFEADEPGEFIINKQMLLSKNEFLVKQEEFFVYSKFNFDDDYSYLPDLSLYDEKINLLKYQKIRFLRSFVDSNKDSRTILGKCRDNFRDI